MVCVRHTIQAADTHNGLHSARTTGCGTKRDPPLPGSTGGNLGGSDKDGKSALYQTRSEWHCVETDEVRVIHGLRGWGLGTRIALIMKGYCETVQFVAICIATSAQHK